jgi:hypothetical protein
LLLCQVPLAPCTSTELTHAISCHRSSPRTAVFLVGDCSTAAYSSAMVSSLRWITPAPVTCFWLALTQWSWLAFYFDLYRTGHSRTCCHHRSMLPPTPHQRAHKSHGKP